MPFKTRKEKESATERRFAWTNEQTVSYQNVGEKNQVRTSSEVNIRNEPKVRKRIAETVYVRSDLIKIIIIASAIISLQAILSLTLH